MFYASTQIETDTPLYKENTYTKEKFYTEVIKFSI